MNEELKKSIYLDYNQTSNFLVNSELILDKEIKELDKELQISTLEILISLAEYRERTYEVKKLNQIKQFIEKL
jgi:hypothetical protein